MAAIRQKQSEVRDTYNAIAKGLKNYESSTAKQINQPGYNLFATYYLKFISVYKLK